MSDLRFRTTEVAKIAGVSLRQLQLWEERRVAIASRSGRVRLYTASQALFVIVIAELRRRGLSFQRLCRLSAALRQLLEDHELFAVGRQTTATRSRIHTNRRPPGPVCRFSKQNTRTCFKLLPTFCLCQPRRLRRST